jgi:phage/plasmid-like protein (TIGR03299 family)
MSHELEFRADGTARHVYVGQVPWHNLGKEIPADLTPEQVLTEAGLDWTVEKVPAYATIAGKKTSVGWSALVRSEDNKVLDVVSDDWNPVQNSEAFEFFNDFIAEGDMEMHTAGSLRGGQIVWALAKVKDSFELFGGDRVDSYLHFTNFHKYGCSTDVRFTPIRVVCNNTLTLSLNTKVERMVKISHRREFNGDNVKLMLGVAQEKLSKYKGMAAFLGSKRYTADSMVDYFKTVFPVNGPVNAKKEISKAAKTVMSVVDSQPGSNYAAGSFWQLFNATTYYADHLAGKSADTRLQSAWYGTNKVLKTRALETALEMANAA